jgi:hypothetical protein
MADQKTPPDHGRFDTNAIASTLPDVANTLLIDHYMTDGDTASTRVFRVRGDSRNVRNCCICVVALSRKTI